MELLHGALGMVLRGARATAAVQYGRPRAARRDQNLRRLLDRRTDVSPVLLEVPVVDCRELQKVLARFCFAMAEEVQELWRMVPNDLLDLKTRRRHAGDLDC